MSARDPYRSPPNRYGSATGRTGKRDYDAAKPSRLRTIKRARNSIDADTRQGARTLREAARWLDQNYDLVTGAIDVLVRNVIGTGIIPEPLVRTRDGELATEVNALLSERYARWAMAPDVTGELDHPAAQRLKGIHLFRDGEVFTQYVTGNPPGIRHSTEIPFSLELIAPDQVPLSLSDPSRKLTQGIEKNAWGRPTRYWVQPHDILGEGASLLIAPDQYRQLSAQRIEHLKITRNIRQTRGITVFASCLERFEDIRSYDESERIAAVIAASMAAYIKKGAPDEFRTENLTIDPETGQRVPREHKFAPGMIFDYLEPGEDIGTIDTQRPNSNFGRYRDDQLRAASAGAGPSFSSVARNYEGNYSSRRQEANEMAPHYGMLWSYFCSRGERRTWEGLVTAQMVAGLLPLSPDIDTSTLYNVDFSRPATPAIDRQKETSADSQALDTFQDTLVDVWRRAGKRPADMWRKLQDQAKQLQTIQGAAPSVATAATPDPSDDDADTDDEDETEEAA